MCQYHGERSIQTTYTYMQMRGENDTLKICKSLMEFLRDNGMQELSTELGSQYNKKSEDYVLQHIYQAPECVNFMYINILVDICNEILTNLTQEQVDMVRFIISMYGKLD